MAGRTLHVRCATWEQVEVFTTRKLRKGKLLSMKVPFVAKPGMPVTIALDLPNELVVSIDSMVLKASPVEVDGKVDAARTWIEVELSGFTDDIKARLVRLAKQRGVEAVPEPAPESAASPPPALPDAPPDARPEPPAPRRSSTAPPGDDLPADERELFQHLSAELRRLRLAAVHDVLGVARDAEPAEVRRRWKELIRRNHPDLVSRRNAPAISHLAEELTILANRAYDRMRARLVAEGRGTLAGPGLAPPPGWLVGFDDIQSEEGTPAPKRVARFERPASVPPVEPPAPVPSGGQGSDAFEQRARAMLGQGDPDTAREVLAAALVVYPRSKPLRSLYHVATALAALHDGEVMLATTQLETALAHHEHCIEAAKLLEHVRKHGTRRPEDTRRVFR